MSVPVRPGTATPLALALSAAALLTATIGHAAQYAAGAFAGAGYMHAAQQPLAEIAAVCLVLAAAFSVVRALTAARARSDWLLPAVGALRRLGVTRAFAVIAPLSLAAFVAGEAFEQHLAGAAHFDLGAAFGARVAVWMAAHLALALVVSLAVVFAARWLCANAAGIARTAAALLALLRPRARSPVARRLIFAAPVSTRAHPLALRIANRPPPISA